MLGVGGKGPIGLDEQTPPDAGAVQDMERSAGSVVDRAAERDAWVVLASVEGLGPMGLGRLLREFGNGRSILDAARLPGAIPRFVDPDPRGSVDVVVARRIVTAAGEASRIVDRVSELGLIVATLEDEAFPRRLLAIELPPHLLFIRGDPAALSRSHAVAVVGTRRATEYGRRLAARIGAALSDSGATVVSGLAVGIDGAAHAAAVAAGVPTVAVLGGGHARLFPAAHRRLADAIVDGGGAVVAELFPDVSATRGTFPRRNRLVSGLADATVVVEAPMKSGALITASWALEQGRDCYLVPGPIGTPSSAGCLDFLRRHPDLARIVSSVPDLIEDLGLLATVETGPQTTIQVGLGTVERALVRALGDGAATADDLVRVAQEPIATVLGGLTLLEMRGLVTAAYGRYHLAAAPPKRLRAPVARSEVA